VGGIRKANLAGLKQFTTLDGSGIRELAGPGWTDARHQSLAEATVGPGGETAEHYHPRSEEIYYFVAGAGRMRLGDDEADVRSATAFRSRPVPRTSCGTPAIRTWCCCAAALRRTPMTTP
jgi:hypothetical protein